jgi:hypothetical protein
MTYYKKKVREFERAEHVIEKGILEHEKVTERGKMVSEKTC